MPEANELHRTALHDRHVEAGARMGDVDGWHMPLAFAGADEEVQAVRGRGGVADVSHYGRIRIRGDGALDLLERACTAAVAAQEDLTTLPTLLLNERGGILDACRLIRLEGFWVLVTSPARREPLLEHLAPLAEEAGAKVDDQTFKTAMLLVVGPAVPDILNAVLPFRAGELAEGAVKSGSLLIARYIAERLNDAGPWGARVQVPNMMAAQAWRYVTDKAGERALPPVGTLALDRLLADAGAPRYGSGFTEEADPLSAGLERLLDWGHDFIGRPALRPPS